MIYGRFVFRIFEARDDGYGDGYEETGSLISCRATLLTQISWLALLWMNFSSFFSFSFGN